MASLPSKRDTDVKAITKRNFYHINFTWAIERFSLYPDETKKSIKSPSFGGEGEDKLWNLVLYPGGNREECKGHVSLYLSYAGQNEITARFHIKIKDSKGNLVDHVVSPATKDTQSPKSSSYHVFEPEKKMWGYLKFIQREKLFDITAKLLPYDTFTVVCKMKVYSDPIDHIETLPKPELNYEESSKDFLINMYDTKKFSDVTFILKDEKLEAHKCVLASCSTVFDAMFSNDMQETNEVKIDDVSEDVFIEMLRFTYTGKVENPDVVALDLISVADKYDLKNLKNFSQQEMLKNLNVETAAKYLVLADLHSANLLKEEAIEYIARNSAAVTKTDGWKQMVKSYPNLIAEIFERQNQ